jgi:hypothetical protein
MKRVLLLLVILATSLLAAQAQKPKCEVEDYTNKCIERIKPLGFSFLKSYKLDGLGGDKTVLEFSYVFSTGTTYIVTLGNADRNNKGLVVTLLDDKKEVIVSSYREAEKEYLSALQIQCQRTGIYYLSFSFQDTKDFCGVGVLGFKR